MKFKAHVLTQAEVLYVSKLNTAPQPELRLGLFNVPAAIRWSVLCGRSSQNKVQRPGSNNNNKASKRFCKENIGKFNSYHKTGASRLVLVT